MPQFDWRKYIEIDKSVPADKRATIEDMLDYEFRDTDKDGKPDDKYLARMLESSKDLEKINLTTERSPDGTHSTTNQINFHFESIKKQLYIDPLSGELHRASLNAIFRHELTHVDNFRTIENKTTLISHV